VPESRAAGAVAKPRSQFSRQGRTFMRYVQHYLAGSLDEDACEAFLLAIARAIESGARSSADALGRICRGYLEQPTPTPGGAGAR